jgi:hypothetical protein
MLYGISTFHCMTVSLALGGEGLGTMWGTQLARELFAEAGFTSVDEKMVEGDILNVYYIARKYEAGSGKREAGSAAIPCHPEPRAARRRICVVRLRSSCAMRVDPGGLVAAVADPSGRVAAPQDDN